MTQPIKPCEIAERKQATIPDGVIEAFNELIAERWTGRLSYFTVQEVKQRIRLKLCIVPDAPINSDWLNVEDIYRKEGWKVKFDSPSYDENYSPYWEFTNV